MCPCLGHHKLGHCSTCQKLGRLETLEVLFEVINELFERHLRHWKKTVNTSIVVLPFLITSGFVYTGVNIDVLSDLIHISVCGEPIRHLTSSTIRVGESQISHLFFMFPPDFAAGRWRRPTKRLRGRFRHGVITLQGVRRDFSNRPVVISIDRRHLIKPNKMLTNPKRG